MSSAPGYVWPVMVSRDPISQSHSQAQSTQSANAEQVVAMDVEGSEGNRMRNNIVAAHLDIQGGRHPMLEFSMAQK